MKGRLPWALRAAQLCERSSEGRAVLAAGTEARACGWGLGCVMISGDAEGKVSGVRCLRALNAKLRGGADC